MKKIAVLTSGGDAPGMNACIRAIVRSAYNKDLFVYGIQYGYSGLIKNNIKIIKPEDVGNTIHVGGTFLKTARSKEFFTREGRKIAYQNLIKNNIDGLIVLGGDGSLTGANIFYKENKLPVIGVPCTIDNDIYGTDYSIGFASARETVVEAIDKIRDTAASHERIFIVEVMGRESGSLALESGIAAGAELILIPEKKYSISDVTKKISKINIEKKSIIVVYAEGCKFGSLKKLSKSIKSKIKDSNVRYSILGHIQRGGTATPSDRILGSILGNQTIECILKNKKNVMVGLVNNKIVLNDLNIVANKKNIIDKDLYELANVISNY
tara:strand:+ start:692 stop:1663 length:972 start_codon:yes stop_codon:yes gene_type:complete